MRRKNAHCKFCIGIVAIILFSYSTIHAQNKLIISRDTMICAVAKSIDFLDTHMDSIKTHHFKSVLIRNERKIYYAIGYNPTANVSGAYSVFERNRKNYTAIAVVKTKHSKRTRKYIEKRKISDTSLVCYLGIYPLYRTSDGFILKMISRSGVMTDAMYLGELYFEFTKSMELKGMYYTEVII